MINLNAGNLSRNISSLLKRGYYFEDPRDISLIKRTVAAAAKAGSKFYNIGELNKRRLYNVDADSDTLISAANLLNKAGIGFLAHFIGLYR